MKKCPSYSCKFRTNRGACFASVEERVRRYCPTPPEPLTASELYEMYREKYPQCIEDLAFIRQVQNV